MGLEDFNESKEHKNQYNQISDEELLNDMRISFGKTDGKLTIEDYRDVGNHSANTVKRRFGSWLNALESAGLPQTREKNATKEKLLEDLKLVALKLGRSPSIREYTEHAEFSGQTVRDEFGSWGNAISEIDNTLRLIECGYVINEVKRLNEEKSRSPTSVEFKKESDARFRIIDEEFSSWVDLLRSLDIMPRSHKLTEHQEMAISFMLLAGYTYSEIVDEFNLDDIYTAPINTVKKIERKYVPHGVKEIIRSEQVPEFQQASGNIEWLEDNPDYDAARLLDILCEGIRRLDEDGDPELLNEKVNELINDMS
jgi:hypothetical protein